MNTIRGVGYSHRHHQPPMKQQILDKVEECFQKAEAHYGKNLNRPRNIIFKRNGVVAGHSNYSRRELMFQLDFAEAYPDDFLNDTVPHEVAHFVDDNVNGLTFRGSRVSIHGPSWQFIMKVVYGLDPKRCHNYDSSVTKTRKGELHEYVCKCTTHKVSSIVHNKILKGQVRKCIHCKTQIQQKKHTLEEKIELLKSKLDATIQRIESLQQS